MYAQTLVAANHQLAGVVLEQSPVDEVAREIINERGMEDHIEVVAGNMFDDQWPEGCDVHLLSNLLHDWDFPEIKTVIENSASSIAPGGMLVIHQAFLNDDKSGPVDAAEYSTLLMHITRGRCYSRAELIPVIEAAGYETGRRGETLAGRGYLVAIKR